MVTRGTTAPNRLRRVDRWIVATQAGLFCSVESPPLVVDLGFGASPITTIELFERLRVVRPDIQVVGLEIDPARVEEAKRFLAGRSSTGQYSGLSFAVGGFELSLPREPLLVRAFNVLRQYEEHEAWCAWERLAKGLAPDGLLLEGTCDEVGRKAVWVTLSRSGPQMVTLSTRVSTLTRPSELAERLPKTLIHRNVPGERIHDFLSDFDRAWAVTAPHSVFGPRQHWIAAVERLAATWPVMARPPLGGRARWRLGEIILPWEAVAPMAL